jgi:hypothetical protein
VDIDIKIQLDVDLQASLNVLLEVLETEACVRILVFFVSCACRCAAACRGESSAWAIAFRIVQCTSGAVKRLAAEVARSGFAIPFQVCHFGLVVGWFWGLRRSKVFVRWLAFAFGLFTLRGGCWRRQIIVGAQKQKGRLYLILYDRFGEHTLKVLKLWGSRRYHTLNPFSSRVRCS